MGLLQELIKEITKGLEPGRYDRAFFKEYKAFRLKFNRLEPVKHPHVPDINKLLCIENQKKVVLRNTEKFVNGLPANDILLWGARGTGKSSLVKSLLGPFGNKGLRIIQVSKEEISNLSALYEILRDKEEKFILFFDDLSFEPTDENFKNLKSILDGDIEERPENVIVYATTNRRHIIHMIEEDEKFAEDSFQERVSLVERFGIRLHFPPFGKKEYLKVVKIYLKNFGIEFNEEVEKKALIWATERGSYSGRTAYQFAKDFVSI